MPDKYSVEIDASFMRFDPSSPKFYKQITNDIPAFCEYKSVHFQAEIGRRKLFGWIACMFDPNSPLRREIKDLYKRKVYAGSICGFKPHSISGKFKEHIEDIFVGKDKEVNNLIVKFITSFSSPEYTQLMAHVTIQNDMLERIIAGKADKNVQMMFDAATDKIKELTNLIYGTGERDEVYEARRALYKQVAYDLSDMRPESVSRTLVKDGQLPDEWNPYGKGYKPDDIHFKGDNIDIAKDDEEALPDD